MLTNDVFTFKLLLKFVGIFTVHWKLARPLLQLSMWMAQNWKNTNLPASGQIRSHYTSSPLQKLWNLIKLSWLKSTFHSHHFTTYFEPARYIFSTTKPVFFVFFSLSQKMGTLKSWAPCRDQWMRNWNHSNQSCISMYFMHFAEISSCLANIEKAGDVEESKSNQI